MNVKALLTDDEAVSPVIGVILMVAITVILAAVIGTFVLGLQDRVGPAGPSASFTWELDDGGDGWSNMNDNITITHDTGDKLDVETIEIKVGDDTLNPTATTWADDITAGDSQRIADSNHDWVANPGTLNTTNSIDEGDQIRIIWNSPEGDSTQTIGENEVS